MFDPVAYINTPRWQTSRLGLERIAALLDRMGRPQDALRFVHVAGTNGKGSVCSYVASALVAAGYTVGLFTSPYIETFEERIRVNGENLLPDDLLRATLVVRECATALEAATGDHPTEFELMTAVALEHFRAAQCDIVVLEVGLGGRLDSTNVIDAPEVSVICRIGLDHTALLGDTLAKVAAEKAGIVKDGTPVVSWPQEPAAMEVVREAACAHGCTLATPDFSRLEVESLGKEALRRGTRVFSYDGLQFETQLLGSYQPANATLAVEVVRMLRERGWRVSDEALRAGIANTCWPGRFEVVARDPLVVVDGGHNPQGAAVLADSLVDMLGGESSAHGRVSFAMGVLADKDYRAMISAVAPLSGAFFTYTPNNPRALSAEDLAKAVREDACAPACVEATSSAAEALARAREAAAASAGGIVVAFGTLYAIADIKAALRAL